MRIFTLLFLMASLAGCAHPIVITPELQSIKRAEGSYIQATAGYYISSQEHAKRVITPGGAGDKISYYPYKELEPALQKVLFNVFQNVKKLDIVPTPESLKSNGIAFAFLPEISTDSYSDSLLTWPPTSFTVILSCKAVSQDGKLVWERKYSGVGTATFSEFSKMGYGLAAKRASQKVFSEMQEDLSHAPEFH